MRDFPPLGARYLWLSEWVAGDAVLIAPVSRGIPCKQGIFQGISRNLSWRPVATRRKRACCSHFPWNSLQDSSGKTHLRTGILAAQSGKIGHEWRNRRSHSGRRTIGPPFRLKRNSGWRHLRTTGIAMIVRYWRKTAVRKFSLCRAQTLKRQGANGMCCMPSARAPRPNDRARF